MSQLDAGYKPGVLVTLNSLLSWQDRMTLLITLLMFDLITLITRRSLVRITTVVGIRLAF